MSWFLLFTQLIVLINSHNITCGPFECQNQQQCIQGEDCNIECNGFNACSFATISCPENYKCNIICIGTHSCHNAIINGSTSSELIINGCTDTDSCTLSNIYCPSRIGLNKKCIISGNNNIRNGLTYYAINGWYDVNIINYTGDYSIDNSNMSCLSNYASSCSLDDNSFQCDPNGDTLCNQPYSINSAMPNVQCDNSKYVGWGTASINITKHYNESSDNNKTITARQLVNYLTECEHENLCDIIMDMDDDEIIHYNKYITFNCCFVDAHNEKHILLQITSTEFAQCIDNEIADDTTTLIEDIHFFLKNLHPYISFAIPNFSVFLIVLTIMIMLIILTLSNWIYSKSSYWLCCWCSICGCMAADQANITILFLVSFRIGDMVTDGLLSYNIYRYYWQFEKYNKYMLILTILNASTLILPYFILNIWSMVSMSKLNTRTDRLRVWYRKYKYIILFLAIITGDFYVCLWLFTSNLFGIDLFDSGLSSSDLAKLRKFKLVMILCENIPQGITQLIFGYYINDFAVVSLSLVFSFAVNFGNVIMWYMTKNFDVTCMVCHYYLEVKLSKTDTFNSDLRRIKRYSKCRNRLRDKLVKVIRENTSSVQCEVYYVEMIGSGCNIHIIHYLSENAKIRTEKTGSIPLSEALKYLNINVLQIYDGKFEKIGRKFKKMWHLKGNIWINLRLYHDDHEMEGKMPNQTKLQMSLHNQLGTYSDLYVD